ncbi:single-stranded DNA-binding protein [Natroniella sulfidigena]|uniref:single-stranded DNA-binding protein n=1 Tax=Natroniella sulfidigena TaxID=723921 RepID=UPI00200B2F76|nr:single-stranded DNA-binding protein [Natroniella sulfidigena]MCK8817550.1 single-stranded DNA-binding protein [Natroniella sulfidigena]
MLNKVILIGRLTRDPELRYTSQGTAVCNFALAVERDYKNSNGERDVDFIDVTVWRKQAETCANHLGKGRLVAVEGRMQIDTWKDDNGTNRKSPKVVARDVSFLDWPNDKQGNSGNNNQKKEEIDVPF